MGDGNGLYEGRMLMRRHPDIEKPNELLTEYVNQMRTSGKYSSVRTFKSGGFVAIERSPSEHREDEKAVGTFLAKAGMGVILLDESGSFRTRDGEIIYMGQYEQRTSGKSINERVGADEIDKVKRFRNSLSHAQGKSADIALVYMKDIKYSDAVVKKAVLAFSRGYTDNDGKHHSGSGYKFKRIITVSRNGKVRMYGMDGKRMGA